MEQRLSLVTLGVIDLARARRFYEALGWTTGAAPSDDVVFFQTGGMIVALWDRASLAEDSVMADSGGWGGVTLAHNVRSPEEVDSVLAEAERAGGDDRAFRRRDVLGRLLGRLRRPRRTSVGGRAQPALDDRGRRVGSALVRQASERARQNIRRQLDVVVARELVRRMADSPVEAAHEEHPRLNARRREDAGVVSRSRGELRNRKATSLELLAEGFLTRGGHAYRGRPLGGLEPDRRDQAIELLVRRRTCVDAQSGAAWDHVDASGLDLDLPDGRDGTVDRERGVADPEERLGRGDERVLPSDHRRRACMAHTPLEHDLTSDIADDPRDDPERSTGVGEHRPLLDVQLEERRGQRALRDERATPDAADLLATERDHGSSSDSLDRLDRRDDAECAIELAALGNGVEVRADPHVSAL
jgi:predicted lactoylglutathione lyase